MREYQELTQRLRARGYPAKVVDLARIRANNNTQQSLLAPKTRTKTERIMGVLPYNSITKKLQKRIHQNWYFLKELPGLTKKAPGYF